jgi:hypothetical protein
MGQTESTVSRLVEPDTGDTPSQIARLQLSPIKILDVPIDDTAAWARICKQYSGLGAPRTNGLDELYPTEGGWPSLWRSEIDPSEVTAVYCKAHGELTVVESGAGGDCGFYSILTLIFYYIFLLHTSFLHDIHNVFKHEKNSLKLDLGYQLMRRNKIAGSPINEFELAKKIPSIAGMRKLLARVLPSDPTGRVYKWQGGEWLTDDGFRALYDNMGVAGESLPWRFNFSVLRSNGDVTPLFDTGSNDYDILAPGMMHVYNYDQTHFQPSLPLPRNTSEVSIPGTGQTFSVLQLYAFWLQLISTTKAQENMFRDMSAQLKTNLKAISNELMKVVKNNSAAYLGDRCKSIVTSARALARVHLSDEVLKLALKSYVSSMRGYLNEEEYFNRCWTVFTKYNFNMLHEEFSGLLSDSSWTGTRVAIMFICFLGLEYPRDPHDTIDDIYRLLMHYRAKKQVLETVD